MPFRTAFPLGRDNQAEILLDHRPIGPALEVMAITADGDERLIPESQWAWDGDRAITIAPPIQPAVSVKATYEWRTEQAEE